MANYKKGILIQARLSSSRFPKKMLEKVGDVTLLEYVYLRCQKSKQADVVAIITSNDTSDNEIETICLKKNIPFFRGDLNDVLKRYIDASKYFDIDLVCRVSGDSPFVDVNGIDRQFLEFERREELEYSIIDNSLNGFLSEVIKLDTLEKIDQLVTSSEDREHVTKYIRENLNKFNTTKIDIASKPREFEYLSLTVDYPEDIQIIRKVAKKLINFDFNSDDIIRNLKGI